MGGWVMVDPDDVAHRCPNKCSLKCILPRRLDVQMGRPYEVTCIRYYHGIYPRYKDDIFVHQKSLHMCPTSTFYITYRKFWSDVHRTVGKRSNVWWVRSIHCFVFCMEFLRPTGNVNEKPLIPENQYERKYYTLISTNKNP